MKLKIEYLSTDELIPYANNPRINDDAVAGVVESIKQCGALDPIEVDENNIASAVIFKSKYIITRKGEIYRFHKKHKKWEFQKPRKHSNGYLRGVIFDKDVYIHRIVAECFIPNPDSLPEVNHKNGDKTDNRVENLEWCTRSYNNRHAFQTGLRDYNTLREIGQKGGAANREKSRKFSDEQVREIRKRRNDGEKLVDIAKSYGAPRQTIQNITLGYNYRGVK